MGYAVTVIGGGQGTASILTGLVAYVELALVAIVTMMDSGGHAGSLGRIHHVLPFGDARDALLALVLPHGPLRDIYDKVRQLCLTRITTPDTLGDGCDLGELLQRVLTVLLNSQPRATETLERLVAQHEVLREVYAFPLQASDLASPRDGCHVGNLLLLALTRQLGSEQRAIETLGELLQVRGRVLGVTWAHTDLQAALANGRILTDEEAIAAAELQGAPIQHLSLDPARPVHANPDAVAAIAASDFVVLAPGSLYTSILANVMVPGIREALQQTKARLIYVLNLLPTDGEAQGYTASHHVAQIHHYMGRHLDAVLVDQGQLAKRVVDAAPWLDLGIKVSSKDIALPAAALSGAIAVDLEHERMGRLHRSERHDPAKLGPALWELCMQFGSGGQAGTSPRP